MGFEERGARLTIQLMALEVLGPRVDLVATGVRAGEAARGALAARALVVGAPGARLGTRGRGRVLGWSSVGVCPGVPGGGGPVSCHVAGLGSSWGRPWSCGGAWGNGWIYGLEETGYLD